MEIIRDKKFGGERPLFGVKNVRLENIEIVDGESGIKCCENLECDNSRFYGKYPWWHVDKSVITNCYFAVENLSIKNQNESATEKPQEEMKIHSLSP